MTDDHADGDEPESPIDWVRRVLGHSWSELRSVYYANAPIWRLLKSGTLLFFGLFCWTGANLLLSYRPDWGVLWYVMAYGFALLFWGPFTHLVVVPLVIRLRRSGATGIGRVCSRHGSKINLGVFLAIVVVLGTAPVGLMTFEFQLPEGDGPGSVNPQLQCTKSGGVVHCHLSDARGVGQVVVTSGGETLQTVDEPPYDFDLQVEEIGSVRGQQQFTVELRDESGATLRRYIRQVALLPGESAAVVPPGIGAVDVSPGPAVAAV